MKCLVPQQNGSTGKRQTQRGVALVITLIMLTIITVIAVAFLAVTHRERTDVKQKANSTDAENAGYTALERAKAQILAYFGTNITRSNAVGPDFMVSRNYINPLGFNSGGSLAPAPGWAKNVSYDENATTSLSPAVDANGNLTWATAALQLKYRQNLGQLLIDPRPPVYVKTNLTGNAPLDFRFFVDLNRNNRFENSGFLPVTNDLNQLAFDPSGQPLTKYFVGDPQWIGILEQPNLPHGADNFFIGRYAYMIVPVGRTLDLNWIHNQAGDLDMRIVPMGSGGITGNGYSRNQGVGTWELNLAAVLADVNPSRWNFYDFRPGDPNGSSGNSFGDATELLRYRYTQLGIPWQLPQSPPLSPHQYLDFAGSVFPGPAWLFTNDLIDGFASGPITPLGMAYQQDPDTLKWLNRRWPGSDGRRHFSSVHDFFDPQKSAFFADFKASLLAASASAGSTNWYTYYNLLAILGTDSTSEADNKININYKRLADGSITNWGAEDFFNTVARRFMQEEYPANFTNRQLKILVATKTPTSIITAVSNFNAGRSVRIPLYSPRIHQLLQIAANIWEATVITNTSSPDTLYPTVFRPQFEEANGSTYITNYVIDKGEIISALNVNTLRMRALENPADHLQGNGAYPPTDLFYGIPLVISAKMGFPNFNEFVLQSIVTANRRLQFLKANGYQRPVTHTNQLFTLTLTNAYGIEAWNSYYTNAYRPTPPNPITLYCTNVLRATLMDQGVVLTNFVSTLAVRTNYAIWPAAGFSTSFKVPAITVQRALTNGVYYQNPNLKSVKEIVGTPSYEPIGLYTNRLVLALTNKLLFALYEGTRIIDFVSFGDLGDVFDIGDALKNQNPDPNYSPWSESNLNGVQQGVVTQIKASINPSDANSRDFNPDPTAGGNVGKAVQDLRVFLGYASDTNTPPLTNESIQARYTAHGRHSRNWNWSADDPLVHYMELDLRKASSSKPSTTGASLLSYLGSRNPEYNPWLGAQGANPKDDATYKDPGVKSSDQWTFPAQRLPNMGWLGRVHRGTPWQTIYLKSASNSTTLAHSAWIDANGLDRLLETHPTNDWRLLDVFTTAPHTNATRGKLSINQTNLAAWSAVLAGVQATTLADDPSGGVPLPRDYFIEPASKHWALRTIVDGINAQREKLPEKQFTKLSQLMATPELTFGSPFLDPSLKFITGSDSVAALSSVLVPQQSAENLRDSDFERIPQQILSLIKVGDEARYAVYSFGQSLRPARNSIYTGTGPFSGICQNYEITGEVATRAILRVEFERFNGQPDYSRPHAIVESFNILPPD